MSYYEVKLTQEEHWRSYVSKGELEKVNGYGRYLRNKESDKIHKDGQEFKLVHLCQYMDLETGEFLDEFKYKEEFPLRKDGKWKKAKPEDLILLTSSELSVINALYKDDEGRKVVIRLMKWIMLGINFRLFVLPYEKYLEDEHWAKVKVLNKYYLIFKIIINDFEPRIIYKDLTKKDFKII